MTAPGPRLLFVATEDWYFATHRLGLAQRAREAGFDVALATRIREHRAALCEAGLRLHEVDIPRRAGAPLADARALLRLRSIYRAERPDLVHHVALKPILLGGWAARLADRPAVVNAYAGLGYLFTGTGAPVRALRAAAVQALRHATARPEVYTVVQNPDDGVDLQRLGLADPARTVLIPGAGVDCAKFPRHAEPSGIPLVVLPARMNRNKGVHEFVRAAQSLLDDGIEARFALVGPLDAGNPGVLDERELRAFGARGVEWWGRRDDMAEVYRQAHVVCLPTRGGEGLPKALLEAGACARAVVTTRVRGCRDLVQDRVTGLLVAPNDPAALARALRELLADQALRRALAQALHQAVVAHYGEATLAAATIDLYRRILQQWPRH